MRHAMSLLLIVLLCGCGSPSLLITPVSNTRSLEAEVVEPGRGWFPDRIALIEVEGMLLNAREGGLLQPGENKVSLLKQQLDAAASDGRVKAVVLRINSPGGTVAAADTMYHLVVDFRKNTGKPVVAATLDVAASGAYYIACAADRIVANPTSVIGSIGVIFTTFDLQDTMDKLGVRAETIKSGRFKDMGSPFKHLGDDERAIMQGMVDDYFHRFVEVVKVNRPIRDAETLKIVTDGRVFTGAAAVENGLADQNGSLSDALDLARTLGKSPDAAVILYKRPYGYGGSIYAGANAPAPRADVMHLNLPGVSDMMPSGFYYLWRP